MRTHTAYAIKALIIPPHSALVITAVVLRWPFARLRGADCGFLEAWHDGRGEFGGHLEGDAEPAGEIGFEGFLVRVADLFCFADFNHDAAFVLGEEDFGFVEELGEGGFPFFGAVGVVVHLRFC